MLLQLILRDVRSALAVVVAQIGHILLICSALPSVRLKPALQLGRH